MVVTLGARRDSADLVGALLECHDRIRRFVTLAGTLAAATDAPAGEIAITAGQIRRYFAEALPHHIADEEELLVPRLTGRDPALDRALTALAGDHVAHAPAIARLIELCAAIEHDPDELAGARAALAALAAVLAGELLAHLAEEERVVFPAVAALPADEQAAVRAAMRARRDR